MIFLTAMDFTLPLADPVLKFLIILLIILGAPLLLNKIRIPPLLGLIIAGAVIGPHGFNLVLRDSSIILSGTAGLLYIMFLAGLEIDMGDFKRNSLRSLTFGLYTFCVPMALGIVAGYYLLGFSWLTSVLLASMFASHTLIAYPIISKLGISKNNAVCITVGGTMITDTLALLVLTIVVALSTQRAQPLSLVATKGHSSETAGDKPEEGGDDVKSSWPLWVGLHTSYNGRNRGQRSREAEPIPENRS